MTFRITQSEQSAPNEPQVEALLASSTGFRSAKEAAAINHLIELQADHTARRVQTAVEVQHNAAVEAEQLVNTRAAVNRAKLTSAENEFQHARSNRGSLLLAMKGWACLLAGSVIEFHISFETLPYALNLKKYSVGGVMISLAPVVAMLVLGLVFGKLFKVLDNAETNPKRNARIAGWLCATILYLILCWLTVDVIQKLNPARMEATKARANAAKVEGKTTSQVDESKFDVLLSAVAVTLAVTGGVFFALAHHESTRLYTFGRSWLVLVGLRRRQKNLDENAAEASVNANDKRTMYAQREAQAQAARESSRSRLRTLQEQAASRPRPCREIVASALAANIGQPSKRQDNWSVFIG